jgi:nicotinate-nucleotide pyrophosphorylase (carboxylating)
MAKDFAQIKWDALVEDECRRLVRAAVLEDLDRGQDWTTVALVPMEASGRATVAARQAGVIAGIPAAQIVIDEMDRRIRIEPLFAEGQAVEPGTAIVRLQGPARSLLTVERTLLNFVGRLSGIATLTRQFAEAIHGAKARLYDTRKTTPGWRRLEKYAVRQGGGCNHRTGLFDALLIKDNHVALAAALEGAAQLSPAELVRRARIFLESNFAAGDPLRDMIVEIEVDSLAQLEDVLPEGPDLVLLDNMELGELRRAVELRNSTAPNVQLEASGGITLATIGAIAATGVDRISAGALTHSAISLNVAMDWDN